MEGIDNLERQATPNKDITFGRIAKATIEAAKLVSSKDTYMLQAMELVGMKAAFPERFSNLKIREDPNLSLF